MASVGLQMMGYFMAVLGLIGAVIATLLPDWKVSSYIGASIVTAVGFNKGLWMECAVFSTGITQCDIYNSMLGLPPETQAAQALMITSCVVSCLSTLLTVFGMKCTIFNQGSPGKDKLAVTGGVMFILGGVICMVPICWNLHTILQDFYNPLLPDAQRYEIGSALYLGIVSSLLSVVGGAILCTSCPPREPDRGFYNKYQSRTLAASKAQNSKKENSGYSLTGYV
ncbi:PREDICTED: claudin-2 [Nanorana parkeri]|uniref:claudin-2 n=1 Tax=Nanorana parkeri TaxID=125878 RepID=UPI000854C487|nr:PREDICTED: claudin-2 [Nanorana parkeri]